MISSLTERSASSAEHRRANACMSTLRLASAAAAASSAASAFRSTSAAAARERRSTSSTARSAASRASTSTASAACAATGQSLGSWDSRAVRAEVSSSAWADCGEQRVLIEGRVSRGGGCDGEKGRGVRWG